MEKLTEILKLWENCGVPLLIILLNEIRLPLIVELFDETTKLDDHADLGSVKFFFSVVCQSDSSGNCALHYAAGSRCVEGRWTFGRVGRSGVGFQVVFEGWGFKRG